MKKTRREGLTDIVGKKQKLTAHINTEINQKNKRCKSCVYRIVLDGCYACNYIVYMHRRRGCPGGDQCTKYVETTKERRRLYEREDDDIGRFD